VAKKSARKKYEVPAEEFVRTWQNSDSADEVAAKLKMPKAIAHARASNYRMLGVKLKKMPRRPKNSIDVDALNKLIEELNEENN
jgi:glutamate/tyrosine decarboxylase-like PLP-dependent enzyme